MDHGEMHQEEDTNQLTGSSCEHCHCHQCTIGVSLQGLPDPISVKGRLPAHFNDNRPFYAIRHGYSNQLARTTAEAFFNFFIVHYSIPARIHSDQGANFESRII